jgi:chromosome segregation ATPase
MKDRNKLILVIVTALVLFFGIRYLLLERETIKLRGSLRQSHQRAVLLEEEKQEVERLLAQEKQLRAEVEEKNELIRATLKAGMRKIYSQHASLSQVRSQAQQLESEIAMLRAENSGLRAQQEDIRKRLAEVSREYESYRRNIVSFAAVKETFTDWTDKAVKIVQAITERPHSPDTEFGNGGFIVKNGRSTQLQRVKIEVNPASLE